MDQPHPAVLTPTFFFHSPFPPPHISLAVPHCCPALTVPHCCPALTVPRNDCPALTNLYLPRHPIPSQEMCKIYLRMDQPNTALERYTAALQVQ